MTLRRKILIIITLVLLCLILALYITSRTILLSSFAELETRTATQNMQRVLNVIQVEEETLALLASRWAWWNDTYDFVRDQSPAYRQTNLREETFASLRLNAWVLFDTEGTPVYTAGFDLQHNTSIPVPSALLDYAALAHPAEEPPTVRRGVLSLPEGLMLVVSAPVLDDHRSLPPAGLMVWGRYLNTAEVQRLSRITRLPIEVIPFFALNPPEDIAAVRQSLLESPQILSRILDESQIASYAVLDDGNGTPTMLIRIVQPRALFSRGQSVMLANLAVVLGFTLLAVLGSVFLFNRLVLARLLHLKDEIERISQQSDISARIEIGGQDEVAVVADSVNEMLDSLERAQRALATAQEQLARSARLAAAGEVAAGVAHQINNPLTTIIAEIHLLTSQHTLDESMMESVDAIREAAFRAGAIVEQMLDLARSVPFEMTDIDVNASLQNAILLVKAQVEPYVTRLAIELDPELPPIQASGKHLEDVVWINLLLNARDAVRSRPDGQILIRSAYLPERDMVQITIQDNGEGIAPENLPHIFTPFFTTKPQGTGLGLAICHDVVERHGGIIEVESAPGKGTTFNVLLPVKPPG
ncbi:MAG: hypothetical protein Kow0077_17430 [Anaerolineae bacterium]